MVINYRREENIIRRMAEILTHRHLSLVLLDMLIRFFPLPSIFTWSERSDRPRSFILPLFWVLLCFAVSSIFLVTLRA
jgi:hypothetical protein